MNLCSNILEFLANMVCHLRKYHITTILQEITSQDQRDILLSTIKTAEAQVQSYSKINVQNEVKMILGRPVKKAARDEKIKELLIKLHDHAWPTGDSYEASKIRVKPAEKETCKWFTNNDKFQAWNSLDDLKSGSPLLLLTAYPGCGKSVLSKHLIDTVL